MEMISVIVPVYYGKRYLPVMIETVEKCAEKVKQDWKVELVLSNDAPSDPLEEYVSEIIDIVVINTEVNRGIQGARVKGLESARGIYVLFLDQDDYIAEDFFVSQLKYISGYDASVCNVIQRRNLLYSSTSINKNIVYNNNILDGNEIVSPGQVLIKKESISDVWKENILEHNGADDWLLWICMQGEGKRFVLNPEALYEHIEHGMNAAGNIVEMNRSIEDVYCIVEKSRLFDERDIKRLSGTIVKIREIYFNKLNQYMQYLYIMEQISRCENRKKGLSYFLERKGIRNIALYGYGYIGRVLCDNLLCNDAIAVDYIIDRNAAYMEAERPVYTVEMELPMVDAVIVSLVANEQEVIELVKKKGFKDVWSIKQILSEMNV